MDDEETRAFHYGIIQRLDEIIEQNEKFFKLKINKNEQKTKIKPKEN